MGSSAAVFVFIMLLTAPATAEPSWEDEAREGITAFNLGDYEQARALLESAYSSSKSEYVPDYKRAELLAWLGFVRRQGPDEREAIEPLEEAATLLPRTRGPQSPQLRRTVRHLAQVYSNSWNLPEAEKRFRQHLTIATATLEPSDPEYLGAYNGMAHILVKRSKYSQAEPHLDEALRLLAQHHPNDGRTRAGLHLMHSRILVHRGDTAQAKAVTEQALGYYTKAGEVSGQADAHDALANVMASAGRTAEAQQHYDRALELLPDVPRYQAWRAEIESERRALAETTP